jgi:hypothetical protein
VQVDQIARCSSRRQLHARGRPPGERHRALERLELGAAAQGVNSHVNSLAVFDDGSGGGPALYVGGSFVAFDCGDGNLARCQDCLDVTQPVLDCPESVVALDSFCVPPGRIVTFSVTASDDPLHEAPARTSPLAASSSPAPRGS